MSYWYVKTTWWCPACDSYTSYKARVYDKKKSGEEIKVSYDWCLE